MEGRMEQESFKLIAGKLFVFIISYYNYQLYVFEDVEEKKISPKFSNHPCSGFSLGTDNVWIYISETWDQNILSLINKIILFLALPWFSVFPKSAESSLCHILTFTLQIFIGPWIMQGMDFLEKLNPSLDKRAQIWMRYRSRSATFEFWNLPERACATRAGVLLLVTWLIKWLSCLKMKKKSFYGGNSFIMENYKKSSCLKLDGFRKCNIESNVI